jgi:hypothetical protein
MTNCFKLDKMKRVRSEDEQERDKANEGKEENKRISVKINRVVGV